MCSDRRRRVADSLSDYDSVCEVGVGRRPGVARLLAERGVSVAATDVVPRSVPDEVSFYRDDVVAAAGRARRGEGPGAPYRVAAVYALSCPPELHRPLATVADAVDADCQFTTLGGDPPTVPVDRTPLAGGETLYTVQSP
ncbi:UPF0146 family protein [Halobaculum sp. MBLA0143]|uniref:UPF0146 family protein n=1 Tax=Halobaculum sp. MBLA0143 TaxID=3079933 RepID=UPI003525457D